MYDTLSMYFESCKANLSQKNLILN